MDTTHCYTQSNKPKYLLAQYVVTDNKINLNFYGGTTHCYRQ